MGVCLDGAPAQKRFHDKECLPFDLLVDEGGHIARSFKVGITNLLVTKLADRVTFVIGKDGVILKTYDAVRPATHAAEVLDFIKTMASKN